MCEVVKWTTSGKARALQKRTFKASSWIDIDVETRGVNIEGVGIFYMPYHPFHRREMTLPLSIKFTERASHR